jgi:hypothetical protein
VAKADQTINWSTPEPVVYGTPLSSVQLNAAVTVGGPSASGALSYNPPAGTILHAGPQTLGVNASETPNYNAATASVGITIQKAVPVVTWAAPAPIVYGTPLSATVGTSGRSGSRSAEETPRPVSLPSFTWPTAFAIGAMKNCTRPVSASVSASGMPLSGTCTTSIAAIDLKISPAKCVPLPTPPRRS